MHAISGCGSMFLSVDRSGCINRENVWFRERKQIEEDICLNSYAILMPIIAFEKHAFRSKLKIERYQITFKRMFLRVFCYSFFCVDAQNWSIFVCRTHSEGVEKAIEEERKNNSIYCCIQRLTAYYSKLLNKHNKCEKCDVNW